MIPEKYKFLETIGTLPKLISASLQYLGLKEYSGTSNNNAVIMNMALSLGLTKNEYPNDEVPWCALYHSFLMHLTGKPLPYKGYELLRAKSFETWGNHVELDDIKLGDTIVKYRSGGYHVCLAIAESTNTNTVHELGGNQSNSVCFGEIDKGTITAVRRFYSIAPPLSVKKYFIDSSGHLSTNES